MAIGPGKYDDVASEIRERLKADGVLLIVMNGDQGDGVAAQVTALRLFGLADMLEALAGKFREDLKDLMGRSN